jgi:carbonic anhydrase
MEAVMSAIDQMLLANATYVSEFDKGSLPMPPAWRLAIVTCMDARIVPARAVGIQEGDAHVIRNAGGRIADAIRSLVISQTLLGTAEVAVIHHTDCGMLTFTDETIRQQLRDSRGVDADEVAFLAFQDVRRSVLDDLRAYRRSTLVRQDVELRGFIYDVATAALSEVAEVS